MECPSVSVLESVKEVGNFISFQQKQIKQLEGEKADLRSLYSAAVDAKRECERTNGELQARLNEYAKKLEAAEQRVSAEVTARQGNLDNFNAEKLKLAGQIDSLRSQIAEANVEKDRIIDQYEKKIAADLLAKQSSIESFKSEKLMLDEQIVGLREQLRLLEAEKKQIEDELIVCKQEKLDIVEVVESKRYLNTRVEVNDWKKKAAELGYFQSGW